MRSTAWVLFRNLVPELLYLLLPEPSNLTYSHAAVPRNVRVTGGANTLCDLNQHVLLVISWYTVVIATHRCFTSLAYQIFHKGHESQ